MKLGVTYNVFDGIELLEHSLLNVRQYVDVIIIIWQRVSNFGNPMPINFGPIVEQDYTRKKLIDGCLLYEPNTSLTPHQNEMKKRQMGLNECIKFGCTHFMLMDVDEFWDPKQFQKAKQVIENGNFESSACQMITYFKEPIYRLEPKEEYFTSFIWKINKNSKISTGGNTLPVLVDPTRTLVNPGKFKQFPRNELEMHHMSWVRKDIRLKLQNSSAKENLPDLEILARQVEQWKHGQTVPFYNRKTVQVPNRFNVDINKPPPDPAFQPIKVSNPPKVTLCLVPCEMSPQFGRLLKQIQNETNFHSYKMELVIVDNTESSEELKNIKQMVDDFIKSEKMPVKFNRGGGNEYLASATNKAVRLADADSDYFVYLCARHTYIYHPDWLKDMITAMQITNESGRVVMAGHLIPFRQGFKEREKNTHIQGGIYIVYTKFLRNNPFNHKAYPHVFMDTDYSKFLLNKGYLLHKIPSVLSHSGIGFSIKKHHHNISNVTYKIVHAHEIARV